MSSVSDKLAKQCIAGFPGADDALGFYLLTNLPKWIATAFSGLTTNDIEDLTSLLSIHILTNISKFKGQSSFDTWARTVTRNKGYDWLASRALRRKRETSMDIANPETGGSLADVLPSRIPNPREELDRKVGRQLAMEALERVKNPRQKLILQEHFVSGLSVVEIAKRWGVKKRDKLDVLLCQAMKAYFKVVKEMRSEGRLEKCSPRVLRK
jgi:RNA polymerase sigma factor (sigma-70 family)